MSDIQDKINSILNDPEALKQVQSLGEQLGLTQGVAQSSPPPKAPESAANPVAPDMLAVASKLAPLMQSFRTEDDSTRLLRSLRPFLGEDRREKLDKAEKMLKMLKLLPLLKNNGLF